MTAIPKGLPFEIEDVAAGIEDERAVVGLLAGYCDYLARQMASLKDAASARRHREVARIAHAIRSGALTIKAEMLANAAEKLEKVSTESYSPLTRRLIQAVESRTRDFIRAVGVVSSGCRV